MSHTIVRSTESPRVGSEPSSGTPAQQFSICPGRSVKERILTHRDWRKLRTGRFCMPGARVTRSRSFAPCSPIVYQELRRPWHTGTWQANVPATPSRRRRSSTKPIFGSWTAAASADPVSAHPFAFRIVVVDGTGLFQFEGGPLRQLQPGSYVSAPPNAKHVLGCKAGGRECLFFVTFSPAPAPPK